MQSEPGFWQDSWRNNVLERGLAAAGGLSFVWEEGGQVLGFVCAHDLGFRAYLSELIVAKTHKSEGVGRQLVAHLESALVARGCAILIADVWKDARGFYESLGWSAPDVIILRKRLPGKVRQQAAPADHHKSGSR